MTNRVVVTGLGVLSPLGNDTATTWQNILAGQSGVGPITRFDASEFPVRIAAEVKNFDATLALEKKEARKLALFIQFAAEASRQAIADAELIVNEDNAHRIGVAIGSGIGGFQDIVDAHDAMKAGGPRKVSPFFIPGAIINMAPGIVAMKHGLKGPNYSVVTACATGAHNLGLAYRAIQNGEADIMVAGGAEMCTTALAISGFAACRALSRNNEGMTEASRPWDMQRDGFVLGEGAGVMVLESLQSAQARGANIIAELTGFGMSGDAYHMTAPEPNGVGFCASMRSAVADAAIDVNEIDYVNAHGTSTMADYIEANAVAEVMGGHMKSVAISSTKSMTGHMLGATGAVEAIFSVLAMRDQVAPPTINCHETDPAVDYDFVPNKAKPMNIRSVLTNSFGFGGSNTTLIFSPLKD